MTCAFGAAFNANRTRKSTWCRFTSSVALASGADVVVLDGLRPELHPTHMNIDEACAAAAEIGGRATYLTHLTHRIEHAEWCAKLAPQGVQLAYDGLRLKL